MLAKTEQLIAIVVEFVFSGPDKGVSENLIGFHRLAHFLENVGFKGVRAESISICSDGLIGPCQGLFKIEIVLEGISGSVVEVLIHKTRRALQFGFEVCHHNIIHVKFNLNGKLFLFPVKDELGRTIGVVDELIRKHFSRRYGA